MTKQPRLCACCQMYLETKVYGPVALCFSCFMKLDARLLYAAAKEELEAQQLEDWWKLDGSHVKEGAIYR